MLAHDPSLLEVILLHPALCPGKVICRDWFNMLVVGLHPVGALEGRCGVVAQAS